jgi:hypothetical protein
MIPPIVPRIRMHQRTQLPPPNHKPPHERPKLLRAEDVHFEHPDRMRTYRSLHQWVDPQFGKLAPDPLVQLAGIEELGGDGLVEVDVDVEAAAGAVCYGVGEGGVGGGFLLVQGWGVEEGFGVGAGGFLGAGEG